MVVKGDAHFTDMDIEADFDIQFSHSVFSGSTFLTNSVLKAGTVIEFSHSVFSGPIFELTNSVLKAGTAISFLRTQFHSITTRFDRARLLCDSIKFSVFEEEKKKTGLSERTSTSDDVAKGAMFKGELLSFEGATFGT